MGEGFQTVLKLFTSAQVTSLTRFRRVLPGSGRFHVLVEVGETPRLPSPVFQLLQDITSDESHQVVSGLVPTTQWTVLSWFRGFLPGCV